MRTTLSLLTVILVFSVAAIAEDRVEMSDDGRVTAVLRPGDSAVPAISRGGVPYGATPDWQNTLRRQVGGLQAEDMNGDGLVDVVVGCYSSQSYPPYDEWKTYIYYNTGGQLEASPSWTSTDEVSTTDIQVGDINKDNYPDILAGNGGFAMSPSVIYFGGVNGPSTSPGWSSAEPQQAWTIYAKLFDIDHDNDLDLVTANQGNSPDDPYRPIYVFANNNGVLSTSPTWASSEWSIQNWLDFADYDGDGWEDLAVSKWSGFQTGIYKNASGTLQTFPTWTNGSTDSEKGVGWADVDGNGWPDLAVGSDPTSLYSNTSGTLTPAWFSNASYFGHSELRFHDIDRDGDEDLAEIHFSNRKAHIYLNNNGVLDATPSWTYTCSSVGTALAFGDINGDQWPDLILGNSGDPSVLVFYNQNSFAVGDLNCDGALNAADIDPFVLALTDPAGYAAAYPTCDRLLADIDGDGNVNAGDIDPFVALIVGP